MALPPDWQLPIPKDKPNLGHKTGGRTVALHSLAVLPDLQGRHVGSTLLKGFIQMVKDAKVADRIALLTYKKLVPWYEKFGFENRGRSDATFGGEEWYDLVRHPPASLTSLLTDSRYMNFPTKIQTVTSLERERQHGAIAA